LDPVGTSNAAKSCARESVSARPHESHLGFISSAGRGTATVDRTNKLSSVARARVFMVNVIVKAKEMGRKGGTKCKGGRRR
jgi:hypothetical protein